MTTNIGLTIKKTQCGGHQIPQGVCECCAETRGLITHHWYELSSLTLKTKQICLSCNRILTTENILLPMLSDYCNWYVPQKVRTQLRELNHILPKWDLQVSFVIERNKPINDYYKSIRDHHQRMDTIIDKIATEYKRIGITPSKPTPSECLKCWDRKHSHCKVSRHKEYKQRKVAI